MMRLEGMKKATQVAILNANYVARRLKGHYDLVYSGRDGLIAHLKERGILLADTKYELGMIDGKLALIDEIDAPDSSRFWPADQYRPGISPPSFDKQFVRDYLETLDWDKTAPGPELPTAVLQQTSAKYQEAFDRLTR